MTRITKTISSIVLTIPFYLWYQDWSIYLILLGSIAFHELGHALAFLFFGYQFDVKFSLIGAKVQIRNFPNNSTSWLAPERMIITLMGLVFTWILVASAVVLNTTGIEQHLTSVVLIVNALLLISNLLPLFITDGFHLFMWISSIFYMIEIRAGWKNSIFMILAAFCLSLSVLLVLTVSICKVIFDFDSLPGQPLTSGFETLFHSDLLVRFVLTMD